MPHGINHDLSSTNRMLKIMGCAYPFDCQIYISTLINNTLAGLNILLTHEKPKNK